MQSLAGHQWRTSMSKPTTPGAGIGRPMRARGRVALRVQALSIDRRTHLELAWRRQQEREDRITQTDLSHGSNGAVLHVDDLAHLEVLLEKAGSNMVILMFTSRTCGVCKDALKRFQSMCTDAAAARARVVFLQADIHNDYDNYSDVARWHKVKAVPTFLFIDEGAVVRRLSLRDVRRLSGTTDWIQGAMADDMRRLQSVFTEVLFKRAPSARQ